MTKDFVKVYALIFFYFSSWVESFKIFDEQQDLWWKPFRLDFQVPAPCSTTHKFLIIKNVSFRRIRQADIFMQFQQLDKFLLFRKWQILFL